MELLTDIGASLDITTTIDGIPVNWCDKHNYNGDLEISEVSWSEDIHGQIFPRWDEELDDFVALSPEDLDKCVYPESHIILTSGDTTSEFYSENGFTLQQMMDNVLELEKVARLENYDLGHYMFEGLHQRDDGTFYVSWGS